MSGLCPSREMDTPQDAPSKPTRRSRIRSRDLTTHDLGDLDVRLGGHLTGDVDEACCSHRLDSDARAGIRFEQGVEDRIGDTVTDLVGVTFGDGLGREKLLTHRSRLSRKSAI